MKVASVTNSIQNGLKNLGNRIMESRWGNIAMPENPTDIAKTLALYSTTTKDAVNCYYYTTQSYNNKKIPEDNRKFVAGIDLANGILNVITQLTLGLFVNKHGTVREFASESRPIPHRSLQSTPLTTHTLDLLLRGRFRLAEETAAQVLRVHLETVLRFAHLQLNANQRIDV